MSPRDEPAAAAPPGRAPRRAGTGGPGAMSTPEFVAMIAGLMALNALAIDVMLPALDEIAGAFGVVNANDQQLVVVIYILGFGAPQIVFGPLTDRYGRRPILFASLVGYGVAALACMWATSFEMLLATRFVQGVFASGARVVAVSVVRDAFVGRGMARVMSLVMTVFMAVPILAPAIGQAILYFAPWEWIFGVLAFGGFGMLAWSYLRLPETLPPAGRQPLSLAATLDAYAEVVRSRVTFGYMAASGVIFGSLFAFISASEQVFSDVFGLGDDFVLWFAAVAGVLSVANFTNSRLVERFGMRRLSHAAVLAFTGTALLLIAGMALTDQAFWLFMPLFALCFGFFGLMGANFNALAMEPLGKIAGTASAAYGFASTTAAGLIGGLIARAYDGTVYPILWGYVGLGVVSLTIIAATERGRLFSNR